MPVSFPADAGRSVTLSLAMKNWILMLMAAALFGAGCSADETKTAPATTTTTDANMPAPIPPVPPGDEVITLGAGCFWCTEAIFQQIPGVVSVTSGFTGGKEANPTYDDVCTG